MKTLLIALLLLSAGTVDARDRSRDCAKTGQAGQYQFHFSCPGGQNQTIFAFPRPYYHPVPMPLRPAVPVPWVTPRQMQRAGKR